MARVLVIGSGGREHALCYAFAKSPQVEKVYAAPGNDGMQDVAETVCIDALDFQALADFVEGQHIDLTFVGPEIPLSEGIVDYFQGRGLCIFGPSKAAAQLESSKCFAKDFMYRHHLPTASYASFHNYAQAAAYLEACEHRVVLKADGLAAGKGVVLPVTKEEALTSLQDMMCNQLFAQAGESVVIEEYLQGEEFSLLAFVCEEKVYPLPVAQDHKRAYDHDQGLNTGGMGTYTPVTHIPASAVQEAMEKVMLPAAQGMVKDGIPFTGILFGGFMLCVDGIKTIEFNARFGDPETEVILLALQSDFYQVMVDVMHKKTPQLVFDEGYWLGVVLAANGYPQHYEKGGKIRNLDNMHTKVFHMGTKKDKTDYLVNGGRVLFVAAHGSTIAEARAVVYKEIEKIDSKALFYRKDIGFRAAQSEEKL